MREVRETNALLILVASMALALAVLSFWSTDSSTGNVLSQKDVGKQAEIVGVARAFKHGAKESSFVLCSKTCTRVVFPSSSLSSFSTNAFNGSRVVAAKGIVRWNKGIELAVANARGLEVIK